MALDEFFAWYAQEPRPGFTKATVLQIRHLLLLIAYWPGNAQYLLAAGIHIISPSGRSRTSIRPTILASISPQM